MDLILQGDLQHQILPVEAIADVFNNVPMTEAGLYSNPVFDPSNAQLRGNIIKIKRNKLNNVPPSLQGSVDVSSPLGLDIRMETGTGKTYVYTRAIFELHRRYGINKFILISKS